MPAQNTKSGTGTGLPANNPETGKTKTPQDKTKSLMPTSLPIEKTDSTKPKNPYEDLFGKDGKNEIESEEKKTLGEFKKFNLRNLSRRDSHNQYVSQRNKDLGESAVKDTVPNAPFSRKPVNFGYFLPDYRRYDFNRFPIKPARSVRSRENFSGIKDALGGAMRASAVMLPVALLGGSASAFYNYTPGIYGSMALMAGAPVVGAYLGSKGIDPTHPKNIRSGNFSFNMPEFRTRRLK